MSPAAEAEVDFADLWVILRGVKTKTALFTMRLSYSGRAVHRAFASQGQEAFLEGHVHAFERLGGVPIEQDPLRQPEGRGVAGAVRPQPGRVRTAGWRSGRTTVSMRSTASPASRARTRRAAWRARAAGSAATTASRCPRSTRSLSSTRCSIAADAKDDAPPDRQPDQQRRAGLRVRAAAAAAAAGRAVPTVADADAAGRPVCAGDGAAVPVLGAGPVDRPPGPGEARRASVTVVRRPHAWSPGMSGRPARAARSWTWTTTWRSCCASPARCPARPRWSRPAPPGCSPRRTRRSGPRPARPLGDGAGTRALVEVLLLHRHLAHGDVLAGITAALTVGSRQPRRGRGRGPQEPHSKPQQRRPTRIVVSLDGSPPRLRSSA